MDDPQPGRQLLVASTGGHLAQLVKWAGVIGAAPDSLWITFESPQSESLLKGRRVLYVPYVAPRSFTRTSQAFIQMMREINWREEAFTSAVSTGAAVALAGLASARLHKVPSFYIESVSRVNGPSLTGRILALDPWIQRSCQYEHWANGGWRYRGSLFDTYESVSRPAASSPRLFVTLGTIRPYRFDALVDAVLQTGLADGRTTWQVGVTSRKDLPGTVTAQMSREDFERCAREADVVVTHSGVGTLMELLDNGIYPVVVPRRAKREEHVDDHQLQVAGVLSARGIAHVTEVEELDRPSLLRATAKSIVRLTHPPATG